MKKQANNKGHFSKSKVTLKQTEISKEITMEIPNEESENVTAGLIKINHSKGLFNDFFTINQEFLIYVLSIGLRGRDWDVFVFLLARMEHGNKILMNNKVLAKAIGLSNSQVSKAITKLEKNKVILKRKIYPTKYEVSFNDNILNPQLGFKGKSTKKNIEVHKDLMKQETPYQKHYNIEGNIDLINGVTGEVFHTIEQTPTQRGKNIDTYYKNKNCEK